MNTSKRKTCAASVQKGVVLAIEKGERTHDVERNRKLQIRIEMLLCLSDHTTQDEIIPLCQKSKPTICQEKRTRGWVMICDDKIDK